MSRGKTWSREFFFFQAEDGIRDVAVTGVQTCALPISLAHLAGALGVRVWVVLQAVPDWRWLIERDDSPWYPTMRLFRQRTPGDWSEVFERVAAELAALRMHEGSQDSAHPQGPMLD